MRLSYTLVVPHVQSDHDATIFQGWVPAIRNIVFLRMIKLLAILPASVEEITMSQADLLGHRKTALPKDTQIAGAQILSKISLIQKNQISVVACLRSNLTEVRKNIGASDSAIILSDCNEEGVIDVRTLGARPQFALDEILWRIAGHNLQGTLRHPYETTLSVPMDHGITSPNLALLEGLGFQVVPEQEGVVLADRDAAIRAVVETFKATSDAFQKGSQGIVYLPAAKAAFYDFKSNLWNQILRQSPHKGHRDFIQKLFRGTSYSGSELSKNVEINALMSDPIVKLVASERQAEIYATTAAITLLSAIDSQPSLRLPNSANLLSQYYKKLEYFGAKEDRKSRERLQDIFREFNDEFLKGLGKDIVDIIQNHFRSWTICADIPIEWIYFGKVPFMISHEVSKLPMTPGNSLLERAGTRPIIVVHKSSLQKILIIRSFKDSDVLKPMLAKAVQGFPIRKDLSIRFVDVASRTELITALNEYSGAIVIFDCHGSHGGTDEVGWFQIGDDRVITWELAHEARIPPIVLLSACHTSPVAGSHASVSTGLLRCGALSVLGTLLSVNGVHSAIFIARIIYRLDAFLHALQISGLTVISWRTFITGFLRMSYTTDILKFLEEEKILDHQSSVKINLDANVWINSLEESWYDLVLDAVAVASNLSQEEILSRIMQKSPLMETMRYCNVGTPEKIMIDLRPQ